MLSLVSVKRITSDVPAHNEDENELSIAGELSLAHGGFIIPPVVVRDSSGYKIVAGYGQFHAAVAGPATQPGPPQSETIPVFILESENEATDAGKTWETKTQSRLDTTAPSIFCGAHFYPLAIVNYSYQ
jgi:hypothetical protein